MIRLKFIKTLHQIETDSLLHPIRQLRLYRLTDEQNELIVEFHNDNRERFVKTANEQSNIVVKKRIFRKPEVFLFDKSNKQIGEIKINYQGLRKSRKDVLSDPNAAISLHGSVYHFKQVKPDVDYHFFKKSTWGHYKFILYSNDESATFSLKMNIPVIGQPGFTKYRPFVGVIETSFQDPLLMGLAFYLFELEFETDDG
jgi:hypothetical protein